MLREFIKWYLPKDQGQLNRRSRGVLGLPYYASILLLAIIAHFVLQFEEGKSTEAKSEVKEHE